MWTFLEAVEREKRISSHVMVAAQYFRWSKFKNAIADKGLVIESPPSNKHEAGATIDKTTGNVTGIFGDCVEKTCLSPHRLVYMIRFLSYAHEVDVAFAKDLGCPYLLSVYGCFLQKSGPITSDLFLVIEYSGEDHLMKQITDRNEKKKPFTEDVCTSVISNDYL